MWIKFLMIWVFPATPLRSAAGRYVSGSAIAPASSASPAVAACGAFHIANTGVIIYSTNFLKFSACSNTSL
jgi:hypothetical protein